MNTAYLLIGGNIGNRENYLKEACLHIEKQVGRIVACSSLYETAAWGNTSLAPFLNQALQVSTAVTAVELLEILLAIEKGMGRTREQVWSARTIDIDILLFNNLIIDSPSLILPHPRMCQRNFVLQPLQEIAPQLVHPTEQKTITELLNSCPDELPVQKIQSMA
jgi:2-amino-4-hydroxy-6-hydroxymethyldihydropteridine diphosphokinase